MCAYLCEGVAETLTVADSAGANGSTRFCITSVCSVASNTVASGAGGISVIVAVWSTLVAPRKVFTCLRSLICAFAFSDNPGHRHLIISGVSSSNKPVELLNRFQNTTVLKDMILVKRTCI